MEVFLHLRFVRFQNVVHILPGCLRLFLRHRENVDVIVPDPVRVCQQAEVFEGQIPVLPSASADVDHQHRPAQLIVILPIHAVMQREAECFPGKQVVWEVFLIGQVLFQLVFVHVDVPGIQFLFHQVT